MSSPRQMPRVRRLCVRIGLLGSLSLVAAGFAVAQANSSSTGNQANETGYSSSNDPRVPQLAELSASDGTGSSTSDGMGSLPPAPKPAAAAAQENGGWSKSIVNKYALEFGGGFNAPISNHITWGWNFTAGGGINFNKRFATLIEYQFIHDKLPGYLIAQTGAEGGYAHIWSFTLDPVVSLFPKSSHDIYVTGGGGFYRKVTSFTNPQLALYCDYYGFCGYVTQNAVVGHFSSNQGGWNIGGGYQHRMGGMYGDSKMKLFAEARYLDVLTPAYGGSANGLGPATLAAGTKLIPVTLGVRW